MSDDPLTRVRERMRSFGFPGTLLPDNIDRDDYDERTGKFTVHLKDEVNVTVGGIPVWFARTVSGVIRDGQITEMSGVKAKKGFWLGLGSIVVENEDLVFKVAGFNKRVPLAAWIG